MKVAILTMFNGLSNTYSLVNVVSEQLKMLLKDNIEVKMLVSEHCPDIERIGIFADKRIEWIKITNSFNGKSFHWITYSKADDKISDSFFLEANIIAKDLVANLQDVSVCIMHDILYQGVHLLHNVAIRIAQQSLKALKFLAFTHSAPATHIVAPYPINCMYKDMPNTTFIYPTACGLLALAKQYDVDVSRCKCIGNSIDITIGLHAQTKSLLEKTDLLKKEILIVYPARLTMAKRFHIIAELSGVIKQYHKKSVGVIFCDFASADIDSNMYKGIVKEIARQNSITKDELVFTSDLGFKDGVYRETVFDLFSLSNLFICPSYSESFGLTVIEAAARGNFIVLNEAVPALKEVGQTINAYFMRWGARNFDFETNEQYHPSERHYYIEHTNKILSQMELNPVILSKTLARTRYQNDWIYENQLKPLLLMQ
ncbi:MAG: glycosyltransferase, partial [Clostridia bacterium]